MNRVVEPEILDSLVPEDPRAVRNRNEIRLLNRIMGNFNWFSSTLARVPVRGGIIEFGAGDGSLGYHLLEKGPVPLDAIYCGVDLIPRPEGWPDSWAWHQEDIREILPGPNHDVLLANLILHQFEDDDLLRIGAAIEASSVRCILLCEPLRRKRHLWQLSLTRALGMSSVSLHDGAVSIRAGFRRVEVCQTLGLDPAHWTFEATETWLGANRIICRRK